MIFEINSNLFKSLLIRRSVPYRSLYINPPSALHFAPDYLSLHSFFIAFCTSYILLFRDTSLTYLLLSIQSLYSMTRGSSERINPYHLISVLNSPSISSLSPSPEPRHIASHAAMMNRRAIRPSPKADAIPVTYTPTTHRISKAKKGKRVHACEHAGCGKVGAIQTRILKINPINSHHRSSPEPNTSDDTN